MAPHVVEGDGFGTIYLCGGNMLLQKNNFFWLLNYFHILILKLNFKKIKKLF